VRVYWKPAGVADAVRTRGKQPDILRTENGAGVLKAPRMDETTLDHAFDILDVHVETPPPVSGALS
jgi:hypothetical protein